MLVEFSIKNYTSFKDKATLSMEKTKIHQHPAHVIKNDLLSGAVIYGANASGKTNFLQSLNMLADIIRAPFLQSSQRAMAMLSDNAFNRDAKEIPEFEVTFVRNGNKYTYALSITNGAIKTERFSLWKSNKATPLFARDGLNVTYGKELSSNWYNSDKTVRPEVPLLSALEAFYGGVTNKVPGYEHIDNALTFFFNIEYINEKSLTLGEKFYEAFKTEDFKAFLVKLLNVADLGIRDVEFIPVTESFLGPLPQQVLYMKDGETKAQVQNDRMLIFTKKDGKLECLRLVTKHVGCDKTFELGHESAGTLKIIHLSLSLFMQKNLEKILLLDELDSLLHPIITKSLLIMLLNSNSDGQIITTLHNTNLLTHDIWRVDEIWFTEKNTVGESRIYPLTDINPRFDKNLEKDYISGKYGAIPFTGGVPQWQELTKE